MMSLKLSWYIGVGPTRSNDYLTMVDSKNAWNILLLFLGVSKNWGFLTLAVGFQKKRRYEPNLRVHFRVSLTFVTYPNYGPRGGAHLASTSSCDTYLKRTWTLQSLGWDPGGMANPKIPGIFSAKL